MTTSWYKSHGRKMQTSEDGSLAAILKADGWLTEKPADVIEDIPSFVTSDEVVSSEYAEEGDVITVSDD